MVYKVISCILATYGRYDEPLLFVKSLVGQNMSKDLFELIVVDQNKDSALFDAVQGFVGDINIKYIKSSVTGLSRNRNIGLLQATGNYVCFPDDDCLYYPDTLSKVYEKFKCTDCSMVLGRIYDRVLRQPIIKCWPDRESIITKWNFQRYSSSITIFARRRDVLFSENLGAGTFNGSCEDLDFIYRYVVGVGGICYFPEIEVWHPAQDISEISSAKVSSYGRGFGKFCSFHRRDLAILSLFALAVAYHASQALLQMVLFNPENSKKRLLAMGSRISAFFSKTDF